MRREAEHLDEPGCRALLERVRHGVLAGATAEGRPIARSMHHAVHDGALYFHGAPAGEKLGLLGQPAVFACEEVLAAIPSYWIDTDRACPATTYFRSVQVHGQLHRVDDVAEKVGAFVALMARLQPEGGFVPFEAGSKLYRGSLKGVLVFRLDIERIAGRNKVGQNKSTKTLQRILLGLWDRGDPGDLDAMEAILRDNPHARRPDILRGPDGLELLVHPTSALADAAADLLDGQYWNEPHGHEQLAVAQRRASAWIGALDPATGELVGTVAALANGTKHAWIYDFAVAPKWQGRGIGTALMQALLDHPGIRETKRIALLTRDGHEFYRRLGFVESPPHSESGSTAMLLKRGRGSDV